MNVNHACEAVTTRENPTSTFLSRLVRCSFEESGGISMFFWLHLVEAEIEQR